MRVELVENTPPYQVAVFTWGGERVHTLFGKGTPLQVGDAVFPRAPPEHFNLWAQEAVVSRAPAA